MNKPLGDEIARLIAKSKLTIVALSERADVSDSWIKAAKTGRIDRPAPERLEAIARETGGNYERLLALSNQLGAASASSMAGGDPATVLPPAALTAAIDRQTVMLTTILRQLVDDAAARETRLRAVEAELVSLRDRPTGGGSPARSVPPETAE